MRESLCWKFSRPKVRWLRPGSPPKSASRRKRWVRPWQAGSPRARNPGARPAGQAHPPGGRHRPWQESTGSGQGAGAECHVGRRSRHSGFAGPAGHYHPPAWICALGTADRKLALAAIRGRLREGRRTIRKIEAVSAGCSAVSAECSYQPSFRLCRETRGPCAALFMLFQSTTSNPGLTPVKRPSALLNSWTGRARPNVIRPVPVVPSDPACGHQA